MFFFLGLGFGQENATAQSEVKGSLKEISSDKTYIMVDDTKILTTAELIDSGYLEVGDKLRVSVEETPSGLKMVDCYYLFDEEAEPEPEEDPQTTISQ